MYLQELYVGNEWSRARCRRSQDNRSDENTWTSVASLSPWSTYEYPGRGARASQRCRNTRLTLYFSTSGPKCRCSKSISPYPWFIQSQRFGDSSTKNESSFRFLSVSLPGFGSMNFTFLLCPKLCSHCTDSDNISCDSSVANSQKWVFLLCTVSSEYVKSMILGCVIVGTQSTKEIGWQTTP